MAPPTPTPPPPVSPVAASAELQRLWKTVEVATSPSTSSADLSRVVDALTAMAKVSGVTSEVIRKTGLGLKLRPLRKHGDAGVKAAATRVVKRWREVVETEALGSDAKPDAVKENGGDARESQHAASKPEDGNGGADNAAEEARAKEEEKDVKKPKEEVEGKTEVDGSDTMDVSHLDPMRKKIGEKLGLAVAIAASNDEEQAVRKVHPFPRSSLIQLPSASWHHA